MSRRDEGQERQDEVFRAMSPEQKLEAAGRLYWSARELKEAGVRAAHPEWTEAEVKGAVNDAFLFRRD